MARTVFRKQPTFLAFASEYQDALLLEVFQAKPTTHFFFSSTILNGKKRLRETLLSGG